MPRPSFANVEFLRTVVAVPEKTKTPSAPLPEMTFPANGTVPPTLLPGPDESETPLSPLPRSTEPVMSRPMMFPWMLLLVALVEMNVET